MAGVFVGTSGWSYDAWRDDFYQDVPKRAWLEYCGERFTGLEINATFYRQQQESTLAKWRDAVPEDFVFAVKGNRYLTHSKLLSEVEEPLERERERTSVLGDRFGAALWQLPARFGKNLDRLEAFAATAGDVWPARHTVEFRDRSWFDEDVAGLLRDHGMAVCISDAADWPMWEEVTSDFVYVRLHGHTRTYASRYSKGSLRGWVDRIESWKADGRDVHVYFDNDSEGHAPHDALRLMEMLGM